MMETFIFEKKTKPPKQYLKLGSGFCCCWRILFFF